MAHGLVIFILPVIVCVFAWLMLRFRLFSRSTMRSSELEDQINILLPQTQCGKCNYDGCRPYARAIADGEAGINRCPPGGEETIKLISTLLGRETNALQFENKHQQRAHVALIDEQLCIGCVKCINACPVDAIIGAAKQMHTVLDKTCTGCELCIAPCPVDCISMVAVHVKIKRWVWTKPPNYIEVNA